jgi:hypothetical protein
LDRVRSPAGTKIDVTVPADSQWARIVGAWGNRGILVVAVSPDRPGRQTYNLAELGIILAIERNKKPIECDPEDQPPYPYSAASLQNGRHCDASPGDLVTVLARTNSVQTLPEGVLAVFAHWDKVRVINTNETLAIARDVRRIAGALAAFGCALITVGLWRRRSVRRQP